MVLPLSVNPCAAAQGALALEIRTEDDELRSMIESISDVPSFKTDRGRATDSQILRRRLSSKK